MPTFQLDDLKVIMQQVADEDSPLDLDGDISDVPFADLGLDSLGVLDVMTRIQQDWHVAVPDDVINDARVPRDVVTFVAGRLAGHSADVAAS